MGERRSHGGAGCERLAVDIFDRFAHGLLVVDTDGNHVAHNAAAAALAGEAVDLGAAAGRPGCDLLGCRRPGGPLADVCLHERAVEEAGPLPELRIDLPEGGGALWVMVSALGTNPQRIVMELRPGLVEDRRRRTTPHWTAGPALRIHALGRTRVLSAEGPIPGRWLDNRAGQILKLLVTERTRSVYADEIVETLWPNASSAGASGLRFFVHALRDALEPDREARRPSSFVHAVRGGYALDPARVWIDADEFERDIDAGLAMHGEGDEPAARARLTRAMALYRGDFLADEPYAEWAIDERERLRHVAATGLRALAGLQRGGGELDAATESLVALSDLEPYDTDVQRELLTLLLARGRRSEAMRRFDTLRRRTLRTFGEDLDFALSDLGPSTRTASRSSP